jgi:glucosylceramidase
MKIIFSVILIIVIEMSFVLIPTSDKTESRKKHASNNIIVYTTAKATPYRITATYSLTFHHMGQPVETEVCVFVDPNKKFQTVIGFGGAITDAAAETFYQLPVLTQNSMLEGGHLKNNFRSAWANYYVKFIKEYEANGIHVWG